jgi:hypothetical protein
MVALVFLGWTLYGVLTANIHYVFGRGLGMKESFWRLVRFELPEDWLWALLTFPILAAAHRLPVTRANWTRRVPAHLALATAVHFLRVGVLWLIEPYVREQRGLQMPFASMGTILLDGFIYVAIVAVVHAASAQGQALRFRNELLEAELGCCGSLQPHFPVQHLSRRLELQARTDPGTSRAGPEARRLAGRPAALEPAVFATLRWHWETSWQPETYLEIQRLRHGAGADLRDPGRSRYHGAGGAELAAATFGGKLYPPWDAWRLTWEHFHPRGREAQALRAGHRG